MSTTKKVATTTTPTLPPGTMAHLRTQESMAAAHAAFVVAWVPVQGTIDKLLAFLNGGLSTHNDHKLFTLEERMAAYNTTYRLAQDKDDINKNVLYTKHRDIIRSYLIESAFPKITGKHGPHLIKEFVAQWDLFGILNKWLKAFFYYLDNFYVKQNTQKALLDQGLDQFRAEVFNKVSELVTQAILDIINAERNKEDMNFDMALLHRSILIYRSMSSDTVPMYREKFEDPYIDDLIRYYERQRQQWFALCSTPEYLLKTSIAVAKETLRVGTYFLRDSIERVQVSCAQTLLKENQTALIEKENSGLLVLLQQHQLEDLHTMYAMFLIMDPEQGIQPMGKIFRAHVIREGKMILEKRKEELNAPDAKEGAGDTQFVQALLDLLDRYQKMVNKEFDGNAFFAKELKYAFETTVNQDIDGHKSNAELLSSHADSVLKTGGDEKLDESQIEDVLEKVSALFSFLSDKDVFADVYRNHLAKRLLNQRSASEGAEKYMIQKLKHRCGAHFTAKFEGMLTDFALNTETHKKFASFTEEMSYKLPIEFSADVLTSSHWPGFRAVNPMLHPHLSRCIDAYTSYYMQGSAHRKLTWVHSLGNATVKGNFKISYDFQVTTLQALAMLIFNLAPDGKQTMTFQEINQHLGNLDVDVTKRILHSLSCQKLHVLNKEPASKKIDETDVFSVNMDFQSKIRKVRIPMASLDETHNPKRVEEDRGLAIEAAIVRVMKARKRMVHNLLVAEVVNQLRTFLPNPKLIKKKIEYLIEREYLERDPEEQNVYMYLA